MNNLFQFIDNEDPCSLRSKGWPKLEQFELLFNREMWWVATEVCCERNVYRRSKLDPPVIPIYPVLRKDLIFAHEANPTFCNDAQQLQRTLRPIGAHRRGKCEKFTEKLTKFELNGKDVCREFHWIANRRLSSASGASSFSQQQLKCSFPTSVALSVAEQQSFLTVEHSAFATKGIEEWRVPKQFQRCCPLCRTPKSKVELRATGGRFTLRKTNCHCPVVIGVDCQQKRADSASGTGKNYHPIAPIQLKEVPEKIPLLFYVPMFADPMGRCFDIEVKREYRRVMLGLGDVIIPGYLIAFCFYVDVVKRSRFYAYGFISIIGYSLGMFATFVALLLMETGQPALLYLVLFTLGPIFAWALFVDGNAFWAKCGALLTMAEFGIRMAVPNDAEVICSLIRELADFALPQRAKGPRIDPDQLGEDIAGGAVSALIAFTSHNELVGHALFYLNTSLAEGKSLFLEELFIRPQFRRKGVGRRIVSELAKKQMPFLAASSIFVLLLVFLFFCLWLIIVVVRRRIAQPRQHHLRPFRPVNNFRGRPFLKRMQHAFMLQSTLLWARFKWKMGLLLGFVRRVFQRLFN
ncbi:hypothetical protein niasHT_004293 [Heterodera trifolii]|uniref:N-acetyltransferase domain-containing protein n=1 Tax=Heterodera trifolii TaxID=157864 RepID=A0ABD2LNG3_9BILA